MKSGILVVMEVRAGEVKRASFEALTAARGLKDALGGEVSCLVIGSDLDGPIEAVRGAGADRVLAARSEEVATYSTEGYGRAGLAAIEETNAGLILLPATALGRDLGPALAALSGAAYAAECTGLEMNDGALEVRRPVYAGKAVATVRSRTERLVASLRPNVFRIQEAEGASAAPVTELNFEPGPIRARVTDVKASSKDRPDVAEAEIVVAGGRGVGGPEGFAPLEELADVLGAGVGASRAVVDLGWRPHSEQVGQTGKVVSPNLYLAFGISGAIQHLAGMQTSKVIVAVNKDPNAPIFKVADYGIVGDLREIVPALKEALARELS